MTRSRLLLILGIVVLVAAQQLHLVTWSSARVAAHGLFPDDAYFYSALARSSDVGFLTLDGEMPTNGVHPLWMAIQILLVKWVPWTDSARLLAISTWCFYLGLCGLSIVALIRFRRASDHPSRPRVQFLALLAGAALLGGMVLGNVSFQGIVAQGLETSICLFAVLGLLLAIDSFDRQTRGPAAIRGSRILVSASILGLLAALCFLARTDLFVLPIVTGLFVVRRVGLRVAAVLVGVSGVFVLPYLAYNLLQFQHLVPISGRAKAFYTHTLYPTLGSYFASNEWHGFPEAFARIVEQVPEVLPVRLGFALLVFGGAQILVWTRPFGAAMRIGGIALLLHVVYMYVFFRSIPPFAVYYFAPEVLWSFLTYSCTVHELGRSGRRLVPILASGLGLAVLGTSWAARDLSPNHYWTQRLRLAEDIDRLVPEGTKVASFWPGTFAQFSDRAISPLDGIVGSPEYFERYVKPGRELDFIKGRDPALIAIYLNLFPDALLALPPREETHWVGLSQKRLWELRSGWTIRTVSSRPVQDWGAGWYLLELSPEPMREFPSPSKETADRSTQPTSVDGWARALEDQNRRLLAGTNELLILMDQVRKRTVDPLFRPLIEDERDVAQVERTGKAAGARLLELGERGKIRPPDAGAGSSAYPREGGTDRAREQTSAAADSRLRGILLGHQLQTAADWAVFALIRVSWEIFGLEMHEYERREQLYSRYRSELLNGRSRIRSANGPKTDKSSLELRLREEFADQEVQLDGEVRERYTHLLDRLAFDVEDVFVTLERHRDSGPEAVDALMKEIGVLYSLATPRHPLLDRTRFCLHPIEYDLMAAAALGQSDDTFGFHIPRSWGFDAGCCWNGGAWFPGGPDKSREGPE